MPRNIARTIYLLRARRPTMSPPGSDEAFFKLFGRALPPAPWKQPAVAVPRSSMDYYDMYLECELPLSSYRVYRANLERDQKSVEVNTTEIPIETSANSENENLLITARGEKTSDRGKDEEKNGPANNRGAEVARKAKRKAEKAMGDVGDIPKKVMLRIKNYRAAKAVKSGRAWTDVRSTRVMANRQKIL